MKKRIWAVLLTAVLCLTLLSGCDLMRGLEKDIEITIVVGDDSYGPYVVNIFNNAVLPNPETDEVANPITVPDGYRFVGWTAQRNWEELEESEVKLTSNSFLVRYDDVKDWAQDGKVTLYPVLMKIKLKDLVVAWYNKETTSFLSQEIMDGFEKDMLDYIAGTGRDVSALDIEVRGYEGNVGASCGAIMKDGDVDIMVGWAATSNLTGTGGMAAESILDNQGDIYINPDANGRYAARLHDRELTNLVYQWILDTYQKQIAPTRLTLTPAEASIEVGKTQVLQLTAEPSNAKTGVTWESSDSTVATVAEGKVTAVAEGTATITATSTLDTSVKATATITVTPAVQEEKETLVVAWYNKQSTSGLDETIMAQFETDINSFFREKGYTTDTLEIVVRGYEGDVEPSCGAIMKDGDVDVMVGWAATSNLTDKGKMPAASILDNVGKVKINPEKARYAARLTDDYVTRLAYWWIQKTYVDGFEGAEPAKPIADGTKLVIGWYSLTEKSGLTSEMMTRFETALKEYLTSLGYDPTKYTLEIRDIGSGKVAEVGSAVNEAGDYDILFGMGGNITTGANINVKQGDEETQYRPDVTMGGKDRNIAWLETSTSPLAETVWNWLFGLNGGEAWLSGDAAHEIGFSWSAPAAAE